MSTLSRPCPVCHAPATLGRLFLEKNIDTAKLSSFSFSSRKAPEYMCHRLLQCTVCDLVYVDQPPAADELAHAYHQADYDSAEEANDAAVAYLHAAQAALRKLERRGSALEIGTGTGIFLDCLKQAGFSELIGVEPSTAAIQAAPEHRRAWIREGVFEEQNFSPAYFDLVCCFMTLEHVRDPRVIVEAALRLLRPGGAFIAVTHDYRSPVNRFLGKRSPIIDIEHMQLFSQPSVRRLLENAGYTGVTVRAFSNRYRLGYWLRLAPLPTALKSAVSSLIGMTRLDRLHVSLNVGNMFVAGYKHE